MLERRDGSYTTRSPLRTMVRSRPVTSIYVSVIQKVVITASISRDKFRYSAGFRTAGGRSPACAHEFLRRPIIVAGDAAVGLMGR